MRRHWLALFSPVLIILVVAGAFAESHLEREALSLQAQELFGKGKYAAALAVQRKYEATVEKAEAFERGGPPGKKTVAALKDISWFALFARAPLEALKESERARQLAPGDLLVDANRAHSLLFLDRFREARKIYLAHKGKRETPESDKRWEDTIVDDFAKMRAAGIVHKDFTKIVAELGVAHPELSDKIQATLAMISRMYDAGKYQEAAAASESLIVLMRKRYGEEHTEFAVALDWLANAFQAQGRLADAEPLLRRSLAIREKVPGPEHSNLSASLDSLAVLTQSQGQYAEAERLLRRSLALREKGLGPDHPDVGTSLDRLAMLYQVQGRYDDSEALRRRRHSISDKAMEPDQYASAYIDAETVYRRNLAMREKALGPEHLDVATSLDNLTELYRSQSRHAAAEPLLRRSLAIREKALGPDHPKVGATVINLADLYWHLNRSAEAEPLYRRSIAIAEKSLGPEHLEVAAALDRLAMLYRFTGRLSETEPLLRRSLAIHEKALGPDHSYVGTALDNLARLKLVQNDWSQAADYWRRSTGAIERRAERGLAGGIEGSAKGEAQKLSSQFSGLVKVTHRLAAYGHLDTEAAARAMFKAAQWAQGSEAAASLAQMAARSAKASPELSLLTREQQDLVREWQAKDKQLIAAKSEPPGRRNLIAEKSLYDLSERLAAIETRLAGLEARLTKEFPDYGALASVAPVSVAEVQAQLDPNEALVLFFDTNGELSPLPEETFIWVVTKSQTRWVKSEVGTYQLRQQVQALRCGLDATSWEDSSKATLDELIRLIDLPHWKVDQRRECEALLKAKPRTEMFGLMPVEVLPFDHARAHKLYMGLLGQVEDFIKGKHLLIVPSGPLTQLPFHVLVTAPGTSDHKAAAWLARNHAITVLPSASSLKALRHVGKPTAAKKPLIGFGNPLLDGDQNDLRYRAHYTKLAAAAREQQSCPVPERQEVASLRVTNRGLRPLATKRGLAEVAQVKSLTPLPETAGELCSVARDVGADPSEIRLGSRATEREIKALSASGVLAQYRIVHFATHGALAGELTSTAEPGLILTPSTTATEEDDGYLTASEIATLKLDADWVILSACNTAAAGASDAEALSGLARSFFYAQARALLVSHWEVDSAATVKLISTTISEIARDPSVGRADALRRAVLALIDEGAPHEAHPAYWAPFVVVGEGAAAR